MVYFRQDPMDNLRYGYHSVPPRAIVFIVIRSAKVSLDRMNAFLHEVILASKFQINTIFANMPSVRLNFWMSIRRTTLMTSTTTMLWTHVPSDSKMRPSPGIANPTVHPPLARLVETLHSTLMASCFSSAVKLT